MPRPPLSTLLLLSLLPGGARGAPLPPPAAPPAPEALPALVLRLASDDAAERAAVRAQLIAAGESATPLLLARAQELAGSERWRDRWELVNVFGYTLDGRALPLLVESVVGDENPHVRWRAGWAMTAVDPPGKRAREMLLEVARTSPSPFRRWNAWVGLGMYADARAFPALRAGLVAPDFWTRWEAVDALGRVRHDEASQLLECHLEDPERQVRTTAVFVLGKLCDEKAKQLLARSLHAADPQVRWRAAMGLGSCNDPRYLDALLHRLALLETDEDTVRNLRDAVARLERTARSRARPRRAARLPGAVPAAAASR